MSAWCASMAERLMRSVRIFGLLLFIGGCASSPDPATQPMPDQALVAAQRMARFAFDSGEPEQAVEIYRRVLAQAYARSDCTAILDARYNLAVSLMTDGRYPEATVLVEQAKADLASAHRPAPADLLLLEATLNYRGGLLGEAWQVTETILNAPEDHSTAIFARTHYLRGLIGDQSDNLAAMRQAIGAMGQPENAILKADLAELQGRLAIREGQWDAAVSALDQSARLRRGHLAYRGMAASLALAADASLRAGQIEPAAVRFLQAGRSAARRHDRVYADRWLTQAVSLFDQLGNDVLADEAFALLAEIDAACPLRP